MTFKEFNQKLKLKLDPHFSKWGFKGKISQGVYYVKYTNLGAIQLIIGVSDYNPLYRVSFSVHIGASIIYRIFHYIAKTEKKYLKTPSTIGYRYGDFLGKKNYNIEASSDEDIKKTSDEIIAFITKFGFEFFEKYSTLESLDELLNSDPFTPVVYKDDITYRAIDGLIIAKVLSNPRFDYLVNTYRDIQKNSPPHLRIYERYVTFLQEHTREELLEIANAPLK